MTNLDSLIKKGKKEQIELNFLLKHLLSMWNVPDMQADKIIFEVLKHNKRHVESQMRAAWEEGKSQYWKNYYANHREKRLGWQNEYNKRKKSQLTSSKETGGKKGGE